MIVVSCAPHYGTVLLPVQTQFIIVDQTLFAPTCRSGSLSLDSSRLYLPIGNSWPVQTPRPWVRLPVTCPSDRQTGKEGRTSMREQEFPQCGKEPPTLAPRAEDPSGPAMRHKVHSPRKPRASPPLDNHTRPRACSPRFELDTHPQHKGLKTTSLSNHSCRSQARPPNGA